MAFSFMQKLDWDAHTLGRGHPIPCPKGSSADSVPCLNVLPDLCSGCVRRVTQARRAEEKARVLAIFQAVRGLV